MRKFVLTTLGFATFTIITLYIILCVGWKHSPNTKNILYNAERTFYPNTNFLFASNASIPGRIWMTFSPKGAKTCINTVTGMFDRYNTCSNCEDFEKTPEKWGFKQVFEPKEGDIAIQHDSTGRAYHAVLITWITKSGDYLVNHSVMHNYYKNHKLKDKSNLTFYRNENFHGRAN